MSRNDSRAGPDESPLVEERARNRGLFPPGRGRWLALGVALALVLGIIVIASVSQTEWGRSQVLGYTVGAIGGRLNGELTVGRLEGNLISGARVYDVELRDPDGEPLALVDSAYIRYRVATFLGGDIIINRLDVFDGEISIFKLPGDTIWNYQRILQNPNPNPAAGPPTATLIENLFLNQTQIDIRAPIQGDSRLSEEQQQIALEEALADTARFDIEEVPGGYLQRTRVDVAQGQVEELYIGGPERGGIYLDVVDGVAAVRLWKDPPLEIQGVTASIHLDEGMLTYDASRIVLPNSEGTSTGTVDMTGERPLYDVYLNSERFALTDLRFLYPWLPEDPAGGTGSAQLWVKDRQDGLLVAARDLQLDMPDTHLVGEFGIITNAAEESIRFVDVDLEAEPLRVESVEQLLPEGLPVEGLVIAGATITGQG